MFDVGPNHPGLPRSLAAWVLMSHDSSVLAHASSCRGQVCILYPLNPDSFAMAAADDQAGRGARVEDMNIFKPPIVRSASRLNKALFEKTFNLAAAAVKEPKKIGPYQKALERSKDLLRLPRLASICPDPDPALAAAGGKCILLRPGISAAGMIVPNAGSFPRSTRFSL